MPAASTITYSFSGYLREKLARAKSACEAWIWERRSRAHDVAPVRADTPWQVYWGESYGLELKEWLLKPVFEKLEEEGKIGDLIVDVGSGARPVTRFLKAREGRKRILVDVAAEHGGSQDEQRIRMDAEKVGERGALSYRRGLVKVCRFLDIEPNAERTGADMVVFSDLLNYVDFRKVVGEFAGFLKNGGRMVIVNLPMRGNQALFSEKGLKDNRELCAFLEGRGFEIEHKAFPCRGRGETEEAEELIVLVARKCG
jgi:SAM-dependent methyltransferase